MKNHIKKCIEEYQCSGCVSGSDIECFKPSEHGGIGCGKHHAGTMTPIIGNFFLGIPKGFNRLGKQTDLKPVIFDKFKDCTWDYGKYNMPVWKYLNKKGHTFIRGMMPRRNENFLHIFLENCIDKIDCFEISQEDVDYMD